MHRNETINPNLAQALNLLDIREFYLHNNQDEESKEEKTTLVSRIEHAQALFSYLNMVGYLNEDLLKKAIDYLAASKPFKVENEIVFADLKNVCKDSNRDGKFNAAFFISNFAKQDYFAVDDIIDLIVFLQQTAFDRHDGVERDRLQVKSLTEEQQLAFVDHAKKLGVITPLPPLKNHYSGTGIMGAASFRVKKRLEYFCALNLKSELVLALSGDRELSKGLDEEPVMKEVADSLGKPVHYLKKKVGVDTREFLDGITETMMVNYLIETICANKNIEIVDSAVELGHWRATTAQGAADVACILIRKIENQEIKNREDGRYSFSIIAEQPYPGRMAKQVQRAINKKIKELGLEEKFFIEVEGCGPGIPKQDLSNNQVLTRVNSELGALMAERFNDARHILQQQPGLDLRDPSILLFSKRDATYKAYEAQAKLGPSRIQYS